MPLFPKIEKITRDVSISHFFLMFGYRLFSLYFPLFLVNKGFSLSEVGYTYLLIYLPIAIFSPLVGFLNHKINPAILASTGILGYALYALGMLLIKNPLLFYFWQVLLGISAALFFVSARAILMGFSLESHNRAFAWFYTVPFYVNASAPAIGAFFIWKFNFIGVFILSLVFQFFTAVFCFTQLKKQTKKLIDKDFEFKNSIENYRKIFKEMKNKNTLILLFVSFSVLLLAGFYHSFFILFLKETLSWSQNQILLFGSLLSFLFLPISLRIIKEVEKSKSKKNILKGAIAGGIFSVLFYLLLPLLNFFSVLFLAIGKSAGDLMAGSGRSGFLRQKLKEYPEETGALDTFFSTLGVALGALIGGLAILRLGYGLIFLVGGFLVLFFGIFGEVFAKN